MKYSLPGWGEMKVMGPAGKKSGEWPGWPGYLPCVNNSARKSSGIAPGAPPGSLPEHLRDRSQGAVLEVLRTSGTAPRAVLEKSL